MVSPVNSNKHLFRKSNTNLSQTFREIEEEGTLPVSYFEADVTLLPKLEKGTKKRKPQINNPYEILIKILTKFS